MLPMHVFTGDVAAPGAATQRESEGHAVIIIAAVGICLSLAHHHAANLGLSGQLHDVFLVGGMNAAGVAVTTVASDIGDQLHGCIKFIVFPQGHHRR